MARKRRDADELTVATSDEVAEEHIQEIEWWRTYKRRRKVIAELSDLELALVEAYIKDIASGMKAVAKSMGMTTQRATKIMRQEHVQEYLERRQTELRVATNIHKETVMLGLMDEAERFGTEGNAASRVRALELLGKELGMFADQRLVKKTIAGKLEHEHNHDHQVSARVTIVLPDNQRDPELLAKQQRPETEEPLSA